MSCFCNLMGAGDSLGEPAVVFDAGAVSLIDAR